MTQIAVQMVVSGVACVGLCGALWWLVDTVTDRGNKRKTKHKQDALDVLATVGCSLAIASLVVAIIAAI